MIKANIIAIILIFIPISGHISAEENKSIDIINQQYKEADIYKIQQTIDKLINTQTKQVFPDFNIENVTKNLSTGRSKFDIGTIFKRIFRFFMKEIYVNIKIMMQLIVTAILCGILTNIQSSFGKGGVSEIAFFACYIFLIGIMIKSFIYVIDISCNVIEDMVLFMQSMIPVLMTLLISTGSFTSASIFQPIILFSVQLTGSIIRNFLVPMLSFAAALTIINNVSNQFHVTKLADFFKQLCKWCLTLLLTVFVGVITVQGLASSVVDGVASKTAKFAVGAFIPIVGGVLSDAVDTVISCTLILKNAVGIAGLIAVLLICFAPVIKILALIIMYRFTAAVIEPVADKRIVQSISDLSSIFTIIFAMVISVALMFFLSITMAVGAGNISAMFR